jgi:pimeloyl-ACP methyl ester carboxylesterase/nucleoside-diphosphate-sugar epimerase
MTHSEIDTLVTGATGFIGRWLLIELTARGRNVAALVRNAEQRATELVAFVAARGGDPTRLVVLDGDVTRVGLGLVESLPNVRDVYHLAARVAFDLTVDEARLVHVTGSENTMHWASGLKGLRRFVDLGGYRLTRAPDWLRAPLPARRRRQLYAEHGAYEASKYEAHACLQALAKRLAIPLTTVHPSGVIGDSRTGECTQTAGLGDTVQALWRGRLSALAGSPATFVPIVTVDYLAAFLASVVERPETEGQELCVLDPGTPNLPELVAAMAEHLGVPAPNHIVPLSLVRHLPERLTGLHREAVGFLSEERYDTSLAQTHAEAVGLRMPPWKPAVLRWLDHLVATRFLTESPRGQVRAVAGSATYLEGDPQRADVVMLHGIPWTAASWRGVSAQLSSSVAVVDLPGLGRSAPAADDLAWLDALLGDRKRPVTLVGHSLGVGLCVRYAAARPERVRAVVAVSPFFLQPRAPWWLRAPRLAAAGLRWTSPARLRRLGGAVDTPETETAVASAHSDLQRAGVAERTAAALAHANRPSVREALRSALGSLAMPVSIVVGSEDPLVCASPVPATVVEGAGHNPHLSHPATVARVVAAALRSSAIDEAA